ncbi:MAG TPA: hypothetical protein VKX25_15310 [Bryobacteraceae bacterium]|jgi:hypothetical protein|nr:hypothetical protein [Bryobacteraceae bacterium]
MATHFDFFRRAAGRAFLAAAVAAVPLAYGQNDTNSSDPASPPDASASAPAPDSGSNGGWKRVGDHSSVYNSDPNGPPAQPAPAYPSSSNGRASYPAIGGQDSQTPAQNQQQPAYAPPPIPAQLTVPAGTYITVRINQMLSSDKNQPGDAFTASLVQPIVVNGVVVAEPGQTIGGRVATAQHHSSDQPGRLGLALTDLTLVDGQHLTVNTQFVSVRGGTTPGGQQAGTVATTTGAGAVIGAIAGGGSGAAIGAGAGAFAGLLGVLVTRNHASVIYPEQILTFKLETPVTISTVNSSQAFRYVQPNEYDRPTYQNGGPNQYYQSAAPPPPAPVYSYPYYGPYWGWGYPYYWGPSVAFYGGWWGGRGWYGPHYYGGFRGAYRGGFRR